jgi:DNA-binding response OmpR family regulator
MKKKKIAVIDDNDDVLFTIKYGFKQEDKSLEAHTFNDPLEFIKDAGKNKYDLILLDIMMPQKNGWDTFAEITRTKLNKKTPIIFLTAKTDKQSLILGSTVAREYITKPFEIKDLIFKVRKYL